MLRFRLARGQQRAGFWCAAREGRVNRTVLVITQYFFLHPVGIGKLRHLVWTDAAVGRVADDDQRGGCLANGRRGHQTEGADAAEDELAARESEHRE